MTAAARFYQDYRLVHGDGRAFPWPASAGDADGRRTAFLSLQEVQGHFAVDYRPRNWCHCGGRLHFRMRLIDRGGSEIFGVFLRAAQVTAPVAGGDRRRVVWRDGEPPPYGIAAVEIRGAEARCATYGEILPHIDVRLARHERGGMPDDLVVLRRPDGYGDYDLTGRLNYGIRRARTGAASF